MNTQEYSEVLRLHLFDMARVTRRGVDYAIKAYRLANPEFCSIVRDCTDDIDVLHREIAGLVRVLLAMELPGGSNMRYILAAERIANALRVEHSQTVEIASKRMRNFENRGGLGCAELATMDGHVNSQLRLSVVAIFAEGVEYAALVQPCSGVGRLFNSTFFDWYRSIDHGARVQAEFERTITKYLREITLRTYEISAATVLELENSWFGLASDADEETLASRETNPADSQELVPIPDGMEAFLESIDTCFADASFWSGL